MRPTLCHTIDGSPQAPPSLGFSRHHLPAFFAAVVASLAPHTQHGALPETRTGFSGRGSRGHGRGCGSVGTGRPGSRCASLRPGFSQAAVTAKALATDSTGFTLQFHTSGLNKAGELGRHELGGTECPAKRQVAHYEGPGGWGVVPEGFLTVKSSIRSSPHEKGD